MNLFHICNTQFEWELVQSAPPALAQGFETNAVFLQLQFLPFLYAGREDSVCVTAKPPEEFWEALQKVGIAPPRLQLLSENVRVSGSLEAWGATPSVAAWAKQQGLAYEMPPFDVVKQVNSKLFSFSEASKLPGSALLISHEELELWMKRVPGPKVLKTCFGVSGKGHFLLTSGFDAEKLNQFAQREWKEERPLIGEPWVERVLDFSTQWKLGEEVQYLGATVCETTEKGAHLQNRVGNEISLFGEQYDLLEEQRASVTPLLQKMVSLGYTGNVGVDAMLYKSAGKIVLHPVVEINARKTMGWAALEIQKRHFPGKLFALRYAPHTPHDTNYLPSSLASLRGKIVHFTRALTLYF